MKKLLTGAPLEKWSILVKQCQASGKTAIVWCQENNISYETFIMRRSQIRKMQKEQDSPLHKSSFVELQEPKTEQSGIEIHIHNRILAVQKNFDASTLLRCIQILESFSC